MQTTVDKQEITSDSFDLFSPFCTKEEMDKQKLVSDSFDIYSPFCTKEASDKIYDGDKLDQPVDEVRQKRRYVKGSF